MLPIDAVNVHRPIDAKGGRPVADAPRRRKREERDLPMSLISALTGLFGRGNACRAFGDGVYLSEDWSEGSPSRDTRETFLARMKKISIYQFNYDGGHMADDGSVRFPRSAESFVWETDAWSQASKYPVKCVAWVRNEHEGRRVALSAHGVARNLLYCLGFFNMFKGLMLDLQFDSMDDQNAFFEILRSVQSTFPTMSLGVRAHFSWLEKPELTRRLLKMAQDVEIPLFNSGQSRGSYSSWCADVTNKAMKAIGPKHLVLGVPALSRDSRGVESLESALVGIRRGAKEHAQHRVRVSVFRDGHASDDDWKVFSREWAR